MSTVVDDLRDPALVWWPDTPLAHHVTLAEFTVQPANAEWIPGSTVVPLSEHLPSGATPRPFLVAGYTLHVAPNWEILTVEGSEQPVAVYRRSYGLRVDEKQQRRGLGMMMLVWRTEIRGNMDRDKKIKRSLASWKLGQKAHRVLVERALQRGCLVPTDVLADYPDLANGVDNGT
jgi:hypothetical protein